MPANLNTLLAEAGLQTRGGRPSAKGPLTFVAGAPLVFDDLKRVNEAPSSAPQSIKEIRERHHTIARLLAQGAKIEEVSAIIGMTPTRISMMRSDPAFEELEAYYAELEKERWDRNRADMAERLRAIGATSADILLERLEDEPEKFTIDDLRKIMETSADRTGHGKEQKVNVAVGLDPKSIDAIRQGPQSQTLGPAEVHRGDLLRLVHNQAGLHSEAAPTDWIEGEGRCLREGGDEGSQENVG